MTPSAPDCVRISLSSASTTTTYLLAATCRMHFLRTHRRVWRSPCSTSLLKQGQLVLCSSDIFKRDASANTSYCLNTSQKVNLTSMPSGSSQATRWWKKKKNFFLPSSPLFFRMNKNNLKLLRSKFSQTAKCLRTILIKLLRYILGNFQIYT